jgi:hypothetical protein
MLTIIRMRRTDLAFSQAEFKIRDARGALNPDDFLALLNRKRGSELGKYRSFEYPYKDPDTVGAPLRAHIDEWLATGVREHGVEEPGRRDFTKARSTMHAIRRFLSSPGRIGCAFTREGLSLAIPDLVGGGLQAIAEVGMFGFQSRLREDPQTAADRLLTALCLNPWHRKLAKCRGRECGRYFELRHWNRVYKMGTLCPDCARARRSESAALSTAKARKKAERELHRLVAKRFGKRIAVDPNWRNDPKLRAKIVGVLNERIGNTGRLAAVYPRRISGKWLSWSKNSGAIENLVKGEKHAKSQRT